MTNETQNRPRSLEEALTDLRRPEVRASLETYVPASYAAFRDVSGEPQELLADAVHYMIDMKYGGKASKRELAFLHEIVDMKKNFDSENRKANEEALYQKGKSYILESGFDAEDYALFVADLWFKYSCELKTKEGVSWIGTKTKDQILTRVMHAIQDPQYLPFRTDEDKEVCARKGAPGFPIVPNPLEDYFNRLKDYKIEQGLKVDENPVDISILRNAQMKFGDSIGPCNSLFGLNKFYERFYTEAVQEIPGLKDKIVEVGRKYGVEIKTE